MKRLYLDMKYIGRIHDVYQLSAQDIIDHSGHNLGNFVFRHALQNVLQDFATYEPVMGGEFRRIVSSEKVGSVIVSCANWLGTSDHDERANLGRAQLIESVDCRVVAFGLGVQASGLSHDKPVPLRENTIRLAKALSQRCVQISVRDELTRKTLESVGIENAVVTGCPSNYLNCNPKLGVELYQNALNSTLDDWQDVRSAISEVTGGHQSSKEICSLQMQLLDTTPAFYVVQTPNFLKFLLSDRTAISDFYRTSNPFLNEPNKLTRTLKSKVLHFTDVDSWMGFSQTCDLSVGMRIHGTMVPLQAGIPSVLIAHDSRTVGLANAMHVPWVTPKEYIELMSHSPREMFREFADKIMGFDENRRRMSIVMHDLLIANGLKPAEKLTNLMAAQ